MKRFISIIAEVIAATRYLPFLGRLVLDVECLGHTPKIGSIWTNAIDDDLGRFDAKAIFRGLIASNRPKLNTYKPSGGAGD